MLWIELNHFLDVGCFYHYVDLFSLEKPFSQLSSSNYVDIVKTTYYYKNLAFLHYDDTKNFKKFFLVKTHLIHLCVYIENRHQVKIIEEILDLLAQLFLSYLVFRVPDCFENVANERQNRIWMQEKEPINKELS